jgi:hypothetical protein
VSCEIRGDDGVRLTETRGERRALLFDTSDSAVMGDFQSPWRNFFLLTVVMIDCRYNGSSSDGMGCVTVDSGEVCLCRLKTRGDSSAGICV